MLNQREFISQTLLNAVADSALVKRATVNACGAQIVHIAEAIIKAVDEGNKILMFGNGGSAADALHVAGEFVGRYKANRKPLAAIALNADVSVMTCISNDYSYADVFSRQVEALAKPGDIVVGISTSGNSENVMRGIEAGRRQGAITIGFTGGSGGRLLDAADYCLCVPSSVTARIQETHITIWHVICEAMDAILFPETVAKSAAPAAAPAEGELVASSH